MTAFEIQRALAFRHWSTRKQIIVPNCGFPGWEADLLVLHPSDWLDEVEIKISASDFRREFKTKAAKHKWLVEGCRKLVWGDGLAAARLSPDFESCPNKDYGYLGGQSHRVRRFWFAMPRELAEKLETEIPEHAGLIAVGGGAEVLKMAPVLKHSRKLTDADKLRLMRLAYIRYWDVHQREWNAKQVPA